MIINFWFHLLSPLTFLFFVSVVFALMLIFSFFLLALVFFSSFLTWKVRLVLWLNLSISLSIYISSFIFFVCERERTSWGGQREREGEKTPTRLHADSAEPNVGLKHRNREVMTWAEPRVRRLTDWATQFPWFGFYLKLKYSWHTVLY